MHWDLLSSVIGFLIGVATGAFGKYLADKSTDRRREREDSRRAKKEFLLIKARMPKLIAEIKNDLRKEGNEFVREFFVLGSRNVHIGIIEKPHFAYYESEHEELRGKIDVLENMGYVSDLTPENTPLYRMSEEFVGLVLRYGG